MSRSHRSKLVPLVVAGVLGAGLAVGPEVALADRESALDGQPAVRHRLLLVKGRFEVTPAFESTVNADYKHTVSGGLKLEYHLSDMLSFGGVGFFGASFDTGLSSKISDSLEDSYPQGDPTPTRAEYESHLNEMPIHGAAYISITPWYGKLAAFQKAFVNFDFYFQGGIAFAQLESNCNNSICSDMNPGVIDPGAGIVPDNDPNNDPPLNDGTRIGLYMGGGIHVFLNQWIALDLTVRNYMFSDNPSGLDFNADLAVTEEDSRFMSHLFMGVGVSLFFPTKPKRTN
jgi:outer membrane beta-barrel protein